MDRKSTGNEDSKITLRLIGIILFIILLSLWASLVGERGLLEYSALSRSNAQEEINNEKLRERNRILMNELGDLKRGRSVLEELAREDLGMVKPGETFFKVIENKRTAEDTPR